MRIAFTLIFIVAAMTMGATAFAAEASSPILPGQEPSVREVTLSQIYRYAREMYRYGNYPEAIKAFKEMLTISCENTVARYHLAKIAKKSPEYADLDTYLKNLPCKPSNFEEEDFLPASLYYLSDAELMLEQLSFYNKRYRIAKASLEEAADNYAKLTKELEEEVESLRKQLATAGTASAEARALNGKLGVSRDAAVRMDQEIARLKDQLLAERARYEKELALVQKGGELPTADAGTSRSAQAELERKRQELAVKDQELTTLQQKFEDIQARLRQIQATVEEKNSAIKALETDLTNVTGAVKTGPAPENPNSKR